MEASIGFGKLENFFGNVASTGNTAATIHDEMNKQSADPKISSINRQASIAATLFGLLGSIVAHKYPGSESAINIINANANLGVGTISIGDFANTIKDNATASEIIGSGLGTTSSIAGFLDSASALIFSGTESLLTKATTSGNYIAGAAALGWWLGDYFYKNNKELCDGVMQQIMTQSLDDVLNYWSDIFSWQKPYDSAQCQLDDNLKFISTAYQCDLDKSATYRIVYYSDPLTLDLDGDGIETIGESGRSGVMFDTDADGINTASGWINADDGMLVRDINKNGIIDNGSEFFGDSTQLLNGSKATDGFSALTDLDDNHDGKVDANDAAFSELKVWRDLNQDGVSSSNELFSLSDVNIASLNVENKNEFISLIGSNYINKTGTYTKSDGTTAVMADVNFVTNNLITEYKDKIAVSEEIAGLPNLTGYGRLRSLQKIKTASYTEFGIIHANTAPFIPP